VAGLKWIELAELGEMIVQSPDEYSVDLKVIYDKYLAQMLVRP
jgi:hypothetical protein